MTTDAPIPWSRRSDLMARRQGDLWVLKDPVAQRYFELGQEAYFVWNSLVGSIRPEEICRQFHQQFAPRTLSLDELKRFIGQLVGQGLVWGNVSGTAAITLRRHQSFRKRGFWSRWTNPLSIRFRGIDPDRWLATLASHWGWLFSKSAVLAGGLLILSALLFWVLRFNELARRWPEELAQWSVADLGSMALVLAGLKIIHELGHGIACRRYGCEVRELGVMLLVLTPCLYCNVSDAWMLPSRAQRMAISAAGMWLESIVAAGAFWLWLASAPGWFHSVCLQIIMISLASTFLFNLNPLLRYDGYFLLSDAIGMSNLQQRAQRELQSRLGRVLGFSLPQESQEVPERHATALAVYAAASLIYRLMMVVAILWMLDRWLEPQGLQIVSTGIAVLTVSTLLMPPLWMIVRRLGSQGPSSSWRLRSPWRLTAATVIVGGVLLCPLPSRIHTRAVVQPADSRGLFVTVEGRLIDLAPSGQPVKGGEPIARLENPQLQRELIRLKGELDRAQKIVDTLKRRQILNPQAALQIPAAERQLADVRRQWELRQADAERLIIYAPRDGILWMSPARPTSLPRGQLPQWSGPLNDPQNQGCWLEVGTQIGWVGPADRFELQALVSQSEVARVRPGQTVYAALETAIGQYFSGTIAEVSVAQTQDLSQQWTSRLKLPDVVDSQGHRLVGTWYQLRIPLSEGEIPPTNLATAAISVHVAPESLFARAGRWIRSNFPL